MARTRVTIVALTWLLICVGGRPALGSPALKPLHIRDDFDSGSLSQWACYPPVQDVGYNPSLSPTQQFDARGGGALMRVVRPVSSSRVRFGFIKRLNAVADGSVLVSFRYRLTEGQRAEVEAGFAGEDGKKYTRHFLVVSHSWQSTTLNLGRIPHGVGLDAIYITATLEKVSPDVDYRFLIDDVKIDAAERASFDVSMPPVTKLPAWTSLISSRLYRPGDALSIESIAAIAVSKAQVSLKDPEGRTVTRVPMTSTAGRWQIHDFYSFRTGDPTGVWKAELTGTTSDGQIVENEIRLLVVPAQPRDHPRLLFGEEERSTLVSRTHQQSIQPAWNQIVNAAKRDRPTAKLQLGAQIFALLDSHLLLPTLPAYFDVVTQATEELENASLYGYVSGDQEARARTKAVLIDVAGWQSWVPSWFYSHGQFTYYPAGELAVAMSLAYDLEYDQLTPVERSTVRQALLKHAIEEPYREYVLDNRVMANTSNWIGHSVGGAILASLVLLDEPGDTEVVKYLGGLLLKFEDHLKASYLDDGSYAEGVSYQEFDLKTSVLAMTALKRICGIDLWAHSNVAKSLDYPLHTLAQPVEESLDMGDTHPPAGYSIAGPFTHTKDAAFDWYYGQFRHSSLHDFLFAPSMEKAPAPSEPASKIFEKKGNAIFRSGWGPEDTVLLFRAGPNFNHNHADQGSFLLRSFGNTLITEAGYADYYKDPYYASYFSQASGHNTVLLDGDPATQEIADTPQFKALRSYPRIIDSLLTPTIDTVGSELAAVYKGELKRYSRRLIFVKPSTLLVYDDLETEKRPHKFDFLLHVSDRSALRHDGSLTLYETKRGAIAIRAFDPQSLEPIITDGHIPYTVFNPAAPETIPLQPGVLDFRSPASATSCHFLILIAAAKDTREARQLTTGAEYFSEQDCNGVRLQNGQIAFPKKPHHLWSCNGVTTDAASWQQISGTLSAQSATRLSRSGAEIFRSDNPVSFSAEFGEGFVHLTISAMTSTVVHVRTGFVVANTSDAHYNAASRMIDLPRGAGQSHITLRRQ